MALLKPDSTASPGKLITFRINSTYYCQKSTGKLFLRVIAIQTLYQHVSQKHLRFPSKDIRILIRVNRHRYQLTSLILSRSIFLIITISCVFQFTFSLFLIVLWGRNKNDTTMYLTICFPVWTQSIPFFFCSPLQLSKTWLRTLRKNGEHCLNLATLRRSRQQKKWK